MSQIRQFVAELVDNNILNVRAALGSFARKNNVDVPEA
jgi:hypothetical protein